MSRGEFTGRKWAECRCGKIIDVFVRDETQRLVDMRLRLASMEPCRSCSMDIHRLRDECPESVSIPGGASACRLGWAHTGRCEPYEITTEMLEALASVGQETTVTERTDGAP